MGGKSVQYMFKCGTVLTLVLLLLLHKKSELYTRRLVVVISLVIISRYKFLMSNRLVDANGISRQ